MTETVLQIEALECYPEEDETIKRWLRRLTPEEFAALERRLLADGCQRPLVVWKEQNKWVDGHHRKEICEKHGLAFQVQLKSFASLAEVLRFIEDNQQGQRNLSAREIKVYRGERYNAEKASHGGWDRVERPSGQNVHLEKTAERIAQEFGVDEKTIRRNGKLAEATRVLLEAGIDRDLVYNNAAEQDVVSLASVIKPQAQEQEANEEARLQASAEPNNEGGAEQGETATDGEQEDSTEPTPAPKTDFTKIIDQIKAGKLSIAEASKKATKQNHRALGTGENEWYTPDDYLQAAREVMGGAIALDPASSEIANQRVQADRFFSASDNGLGRPWKAETLWMNPPYSQPAIRLFSEKLAEEWQAGNLGQAIALTHNYTDTKWFHTLASACDAICFTRGRIKFVSPEGKEAAPTQGQAFFYFGANVEQFQRSFSAFGLAVRVLKEDAA